MKLKMLMVEDVKSYTRFPDFRRKVLEIAEREINELTDITISYETITKGRKVVKIKFDIVFEGYYGTLASWNDSE